MAAVNAAIEAFAKANAIDLAPVRVNVTAPGLVATPF
jgi:NAD(P)-dependent dehydrogenase (short-subunit alcohol dehydrogenase family)